MFDEMWSQRIQGLSLDRSAGYLWSYVLRNYAKLNLKYTCIVLNLNVLIAPD